MSEALTIPSLDGKVHKLLAVLDEKLSQCEVCHTHCAKQHPDARIAEQRNRQERFATDPCVQYWIAQNPKAQFNVPWDVHLPSTYREYVAIASAFAERNIRLDAAGFFEVRYEHAPIIERWKLQDKIASYLKQTRTGTAPAITPSAPHKTDPSSVIISVRPRQSLTLPPTVPAPSFSTPVPIPQERVAQQISPPAEIQAPSISLVEHEVQPVPQSQPGSTSTGTIYPIAETEFTRLVNGHGPLKATYSEPVENLMSDVLKNAHCDVCGKVCIKEFPHHVIWEQGNKLSSAGCYHSFPNQSEWVPFKGKYPGKQYDRISFDIITFYACASVLAPSAHAMTPKKFFEARHDLPHLIAQKGLTQAMWDSYSAVRHAHQAHPGTVDRCGTCFWYKNL